MIQPLKRAMKVIMPVQGEIPPFSTSRMTVYPQNLFKAEKFFIPNQTIASSVAIKEFKVGNSPCGLLEGHSCIGEIPGEYFWATTEAEINEPIEGCEIVSRFPLELTFYAAEVGNGIYVTVRNKTEELINFHGLFYGTIAR